MNNLIQASEELFAKCLITMENKNHDYAGKEDANGLENFNLTAKVSKISRDKGILIRLMDKMTRIGNLLSHDAKVKSESLHDTISDAINYLAILNYSLQEE